MIKKVSLNLNRNISILSPKGDSREYPLELKKAIQLATNIVGRFVGVSAFPITDEEYPELESFFKGLDIRELYADHAKWTPVVADRIFRSHRMVAHLSSPAANPDSAIMLGIEWYDRDGDRVGGLVCFIDVGLDVHADTMSPHERFD